MAGQRPVTPTGAGHSLYFGLLGHFQGVIDLDAEITNRTLPASCVLATAERPAGSWSGGRSRSPSFA
jgi:hypothetical protein